MKTLMIAIFMLLSLSLKAQNVLSPKLQEMLKYLADTREMVKQEKYKEALDRYIWFYDATENDRAMGGIRASSALREWKSLGDVYPPAMTALIETRDRTAKKIINNGFTVDLAGDIKALNRTLGEDSKMIDLLQTLAQTKPDEAKLLWIYSRDIVFAAKRYDIVSNYVGNPVREYSVLKEQYERLTEMSKDPRFVSSAERLKKVQADRLVEQSVQLIHFALFMNDIKSAKEIQQQAIAIVDDSRLRDAIPAEKKN
jgi:hypothetical protein